ncbi:MAG: NAD(P)-binding domain-containing protein [Pleurocapsa sp. MO_226.B13]|nr:NAD(P)-binding domain-containing protein [Pleurocapsa sp. MO_226.B13]
MLSDYIEHKYLIIGAGPAGLQMGYFLQQNQCDYLILEKSNQIASFFRTLPRSRQLISFNRVHSVFDDPEILLRWDWNSLLTDDYSFLFRNFSRRLYPLAEELVSYLEAFAKEYHLNICYKTAIAHIQKTSQGSFELQTTEGKRYRCQVLIIATGLGRPYIPDIPGIEAVEHYETVSMDSETYAGQRVLVIGKGNSAFEIADVALESAAIVHVASPSSISLAYNSRHPGHLRVNYSRLLDAYHLKTLNGMLDCHIHNIEKQTDGTFVVTVAYVHADGEVEELVYDRVIRCTGFRFDTSFYDANCTPETILAGRLPAITPYWESTNVSGLFFAGTLMQGRDFKRSSSAFIDGFRYNIRTLCRYLLNRYDDMPIPMQTLQAMPQALSRAVLERACRTSALWAQFGYLCDVFVVRDAVTIDWYEELPLQALQEGDFATEAHYYSLTFEWGQWQGNVMAIARHPHADEAYKSVFLHPIIRRYCYGKLISEHHILEDLFGIYAAHRERGTVRSRNYRKITQYHQEMHEQPLEQYFEREFIQKDSLRNQAVKFPQQKIAKLVS